MDVDALLAAMGGEEPPAAVAAGEDGATGGAAPSRGVEVELSARLLAPSDLWNPRAVWTQEGQVEDSSLKGLAREPPAAQSAHTEVMRQKAMRALKERFAALALQLSVGWDSADTNVAFERWLMARKVSEQGPAHDPLLPTPSTAKDGRDDGLRRDLFSQRLPKRAVNKFCTGVQKAVHASKSAFARSCAVAGSKLVAVEGLELDCDVGAGWGGQGVLRLRYGATCSTVNRAHFEKLLAMYQLEWLCDAPERPPRAGQQGKVWKNPREACRFAERVFCLLVRYAAMQGGGVHGGGFQAAANGEVFDALLQDFGCAFECFASPLNARYRHFCAALGPSVSGADPPPTPGVGLPTKTGRANTILCLTLFLFSVGSPHPVLARALFSA